MMLHFSMSSLLMSVLFSNVLLIMLYVIFHNTDFMLDLGYRLLAVFLAATLLRFLFPFELPRSVRIDLPQGLSWVSVFIKKRRFLIGAWKFSLWHVFLLLWLAGCMIGILLLIRSYRRFYRSIRILGTDITDQEPCHSILEGIYSQQKETNCFRIVEMPGISSPMITGLFHPVILIPQKLSLATENWYYILNHETAHYFHHDLWTKLFAQLLCILYWWNPLLYALRRQVSTMLELRIDRTITASGDPRERLHYMECLNHVAKQETAKANPLAISFCPTGSSPLLQRFQMMENNESHGRNRRKQFLISGIIVGLYLFSTIFIFEPDYTPPDVAKDSYELTIDSAYFIVNPEGGYDLYMEGQFIKTFHDPIDESLHNLKIYYKEEIIYE